LLRFQPCALKHFLSQAKNTNLVPEPTDPDLVCEKLSRLNCRWSEEGSEKGISVFQDHLRKVRASTRSLMSDMSGPLT
jgi:hypothetical protein